MAKVKSIAIGNDRLDLVDKTAFDEEATKREQADVALQASINSKVGDLTALKTTAKDSVVDAINNLHQDVLSYKILDKTTYDGLSEEEKNKDILYFVVNP